MPLVQDTNNPLAQFSFNRREMYGSSTSLDFSGNRSEAIAPNVNSQILQPLQSFLPGSIPSQALGTYDTGNAGITSQGDDDSSIRGWAGSNFANRGTAPFRFDRAGNLWATSATIAGAITPQVVVVAGEDINAGDLVCINQFDARKEVATQDARVLQSSAGTNYGGDTTAVIGSTNALNTGASYFYIKFTAPLENGTLADVRAFLRLCVDSYNTDLGALYEFRVYQVDGADWDESTLTWTNKPSFNATQESAWQACRTFALTSDFLEDSAGLNYIFFDISALYRKWMRSTASQWGVVVRLVARATGSEAAAAIVNATVRTSEHATTLTRPTILVADTGASHVGKAYKADSDNIKTSYGVLGVATSTVTAGNNITLQLGGIATVNTLLTPGLTYYVSPSSGRFGSTPGTSIRSIVVGQALTNSTILLTGPVPKKVADEIVISGNDANGFSIINTLFYQLGFTPSKITFTGVITSNNVTVATANGIYTSSGNSGNSAVNDGTTIEFNNSQVIRYTGGAANTLVVMDVSEAPTVGVILTFTLQDQTAAFEQKGFEGIITFEE